MPSCLLVLVYGLLVNTVIYTKTFLSFCQYCGKCLKEKILIKNVLFILTEHQ